MKVCFNTWSAAFFNPGGGEAQLLFSKKALENKGVQVSLYNQWSPQESFDIFHQFSVQLGGNYIVDEYRSRGKKIALSTILWADFDKNDFFYWQIRDLLNKSEVLFTNSEAESVKLSKSFDMPLSKFHKTRNGVSDFYLTLGDKTLFQRKFSLPNDFVLSVANIDRRKNTRNLIEACAKLNFDLVLIGAIRDHDYFNEIKNIYNRVRFLGPIHSEELVRSAYRACRVFCLPSLCETPGISALEALSQEAKVVVTQEGATKEYFQEHAKYVDPMDISSICESIEESWSKSEYQNHADFIRSNYTWSLAADDILAGYKRLENGV